MAKTMLKKKSFEIAHVATSYGSVMTILDSKMRELNKFEDIDVTAISSPTKKLTREHHR